MEWYYVLNGQQVGPVPADQFERLHQSGTITAETPVWHDGMADWQPYQSVRPPPVVQEAARCANCGKPFPTGDMISYQGSWICAACKPVFVQKLKEGIFTPKSGIWRSGRTLVMTREAILPNACVKCNAPDHTRRLARNLYWHHPAIYLLILLSILIYAIVALLVRQRARIEVGLCERHVAQRRWTILVCWLAGLLGAGVLVLGSIRASGVLIGLGIFLLLIALFYGVIKTRIVHPVRIDKEYVRLKGACADYLASFPEWPGPA